MPTTAHFGVIHIARALTSSMLRRLVEADAALGGPQPRLCWTRIAGEDLDLVVHLDREVDRELATRLAEDAAQPGVEVELVRCEVELLLGDVPGVDRRRCLFRRHERRILS
jgi:hypothetical protein